MMATLVFQIADFVRGAWSEPLSLILYVRLIYLALSVFGIYLVNRLNSPIGIDWTVLIWTLITGIQVLIIDVSRPDDYVHHLMIDIVFIVFLYTVFPNQVLNQLAVGLLFSGPLIFIVVEEKTGIPDMGKFAVVSTILFVNAVGYFISRRHHMLMRREFLHHRKEKMLREELEHALAEKNALLDEQKRSASVRSRIYSIIGHDLRNPLHGIQGFAETLITADHELESQEAVKTGGYIYQLSKQLRSLLDNLLDWTRISRDRFPFNPEQLDLGSLIHDVIKDYELLATNKDINIYYHSELSVMVEADKQMIQSVLRNLLMNAIKFTEKGGRIDVELATIEGKVIVAFSDTGIGIDNMVLNRLKSSEQLPYSSSGTAGETGSGLGLNLCQEFVAHHKGSFDIRSKKGEGTTVEFSLPLNQNKRNTPVSGA